MSPTGAPAPAPGPTAPQTIVVGAGIVGLSTAWHLVRQGHRVTVVERGPIPNPLASSADHHRLIRFSYGASRHYTERMGEAVAAWRDLWADLPGPQERYYAATGILSLSQEDGDWTDRSRVLMETFGVPFERIDGLAALARRFPFLEAANVSYGVLSEGGALMANAILVDLAQRLREAGATIAEHAQVTAVDPAAGRVNLADGRVLEGDAVVVAAGVMTPALVPELAGTLVPHRTMIVYAEPPEDLRAAWQGAPCWTHLGGETHLWGMSPVGALPAKLGCAPLGHRDPDIANRTITIEEMERVRQYYQGRFIGAERFHIRWGQANYWTHAPDERFVLRQMDRALVVSACSGHGFKFGALSGRDVADALTGAAPVDVVAQRMAGPEPDARATA